jgi:predicted small secreted protein
VRRSRGVLAALGAGCVFVASCATASRTGSDNQLFVESEPAGASIFVNEMFAGVSPRLVPVPRDHTLRIRCSLDGYRDETTSVYREIAPAAAWDSPVFAVLDELSGSAYRLQRKTLLVELTPVTAHGAGR